MRIKHLNMINMNMMKEAIDVLINSEKHILIIGESGTGKSTLLTELLMIQNLFDTVISLTRSYDEIGCTVIIPVPELIKYE